MNKKDFPIFKKNPGLVYLDSAATSLKPQCVIDAENEYYSDYGANVHRGLYKISEKATQMYEGSRCAVQKFINAASEKEIIFTSGTTAAINLVAMSWGEQNLRSGDEIILTILEHHANIVPWQMLKKKTNCVIKFADINADGTLDLDGFRKLLTKRTKLVAISHVSNVLGTINPAKRIVQLAHAAGAKVLIDAAQSVPHLKVDVRHLDCDFLAFSGHKICGPTGIGVLYAKEKIMKNTAPIFGGGDMIREVYKTHSTWNDLPWKFEAGTPAIAQAIGLGAAIEYLEKVGIKNIQKHDAELMKYALNKLSKIKGVVLYGPCDPKIQTSAISFNIKGIHAHDTATLLDQENVAVRAGHHCCMPLMQRLGITATVRASFYLYSSKKDIDRLVLAILKAKKTFKI